MADDWQLATLGDAIDLNPQVKLDRDVVYPFVDMAALDPGRRSVGPSEDRVYKGSGSRFAHGDTLFARITPCLENGKICRYSAPELAASVAHGSTEFIVLRGKPGITDSGFVYYLSRSDDLRTFAVGQMNGSSGRQRVPVTSLASYPFLLPPYEDQLVIASILGALDDKIELNRRMAQTFEEMARALFKSWFVDFDPVRAKAEGRDPNLPKHLADLFPDRLIDSELGEIPEGWSVSTVGEEFRITMGQSPPGDTYNEVGDGLPFYQGRVDFGSRFPRRRVYCSAPTRFAERDDTLVSVRAPVGDVNMASERCAIGRGVAAVRHSTGARSYTFQAMKEAGHLFAKFNAEGTVFGAINKKDFHGLMCLCPPADIVAEFERQAQGIDDRIEVCAQSVETSSALRDSLLPLLVSGEVRLPDPEGLLARLEAVA